MELVPYVLAYLGIAVFIVAVIMRFMMWTKMPMHVRWELYPVAHEAKKAHYGGSYLEESEWWKKPRESSMMGELKVMIPEILFLVAVKEHNPSLWVRTFPFHFGLYMVIAATVMMAGTAVGGLILPSLFAGGLGTLIQYAVVAVGAGGLALGIFGALGLLHRRLTDPALKDFTSGADIFNLLFFIVAFGCALLSFLLVDRDFTRVAFFWQNLVTFNLMPLPGSGLEVLLPILSVVLLSAMVAYIPLTHMSHFIGKYFAYHAIRWNDTPNLAGGEQEGAIQELLSRKVSWAGPHIKGEGTKTWVDVATELPEKQEKP
jgi:nitrate reductase gamma subunit